MTAQTDTYTIRQHLKDRTAALRAGELQPLEVIRYTREDEPGIAIVELLVGYGGPTDRITWDRRGAGWSEYLHSDYPHGTTLDDDTWDYIGGAYTY